MDRRTEFVKNPDGAAALLDGRDNLYVLYVGCPDLRIWLRAVGSRAEGRAQLLYRRRVRQVSAGPPRWGHPLSRRVASASSISAPGRSLFLRSAISPGWQPRPAHGTAPATIQIVPSTTGLAAGTYTGHVILTAGGSSKIVTVSLGLTGPVSVQHTVALAWKIPAAGKVIRDNM